MMGHSLAYYIRKQYILFHTGKNNQHHLALQAPKQSSIASHSICFSLLHHHPTSTIPLYLHIYSSSIMTHLYYQLPQLVNSLLSMTENFPKEQLIAALTNTFIGHSKTLKDTADYLAEAARSVGFTMKMMDIVDDGGLAVEIKQAALIQLKNNVKLRWNATRDQISAGEKQSIKSALLLAVIRCSKLHKLIKIYKQVFTIIIGMQYKSWLPVLPILERIKQEKDIVPLLHILLSIAASFEFSITEDERSYFFEFIKVVLPVLLHLITKHQDYELIYLSIKFLWKAVHYEINPEIKTLACGWMPILHMIIGATNQAYDKHPDQIQPRESPQFYYFHSKKWASRIFLRFIQKHAKALTYNKKQDNKIFSENWYNTYGNHLITALINQFANNTVKKVRYFQLKCLQTLISERPDAVKQYAEVFQYDILLRYIKLQPEDQQLAQRQPVQFLTRQDEPSINFTNLKRVATDAWIGYAQLGSKQQKKSQTYQPGVFFYQNMNYLQTKLQGNNPIEKQYAMYLICQLRLPIIRCKHVKGILPTLISRYVISEFQNSIMFLRARAVDIFSDYGSMELDVDMIKKAVEGIYLCLTKDEYPLVRIKAASAFNCILKHKAAKDLVQPLLQDILTVYLQLLEHYDLENIINSLQSIVEDFSSQIAPFAFDLIKHLGLLFFKLFNKDIEQANQESYDGEAQLAAAGCLKTITRIIQSPIPQEVINQLEPEIIKLLQFIFGQEGSDYVEDSLIMLNAYLFKVQKMSGILWFFFQAVIYNMVGVPKEMWAVIQKVQMPQKHLKILKHMKHGDNFEMMEQAMPVLRNYIQKSSQMITEQQMSSNSEALKANLVSLLFYLLSQVYKKGPNDFSGQLDITCGTALLIYLLENYQHHLSETTYNHVWQFSKVNILKFKSKMLKILNSQLIALLLWICPTQILTLAHNQKMLPALLKEITSYQSKYEMEHERQRVILGLISLLSLPQKPAEILQKMPQIFKIALKLVRKNAEDRLAEDGDDEENKSEDDEDDLQNFDDCNFNADDDEDFWEQQYDDNYSSKLDTVDQIGEFKKVITKLSAQQNAFYLSLIQTVTKEELISLDQKISKALEKVQKSVLD